MASGKWTYRIYASLTEPVNAFLISATSIYAHVQRIVHIDLYYEGRYSGWTCKPSSPEDALEIAERVVRILNFDDNLLEGNWFVISF